MGLQSILRLHGDGGVNNKSYTLIFELIFHWQNNIFITVLSVIIQNTAPSRCIVSLAVSVSNVWPQPQQTKLLEAGAGWAVVELAT